MQTDRKAAGRGRTFPLAAALAAILALGGCNGMLGGPAASSVGAGSTPYARQDLGTLTYRAVDLMLASASELPQATPLIVASIVDVRDVEKSSAFGNIISDMVRTRLVQSGRAVSEMRMRNAVLMAKVEGEMALSRDKRAIKSGPLAAAVVTGTYALAAARVYVSLKIISTSDARILAAADLVVPLDNEVNGLLGN